MGQGSFVWMTTDGTKTWSPVPAEDPVALYIGGARWGHTGAVSEPELVFGSPDEQNWNFSLALIYPSGGVVSQNIETFGDYGYFGAAGGDPDSGEGVAVSVDGGLTFDFYKADPLKTMARYGAYPSDTTWYISGGTWPRSSVLENDPTVVHEISERIHIRRQPDVVPLQTSYDFSSMAWPLASGVRNDSYEAQIVKTTDGGKTWSSVYWNEGNFYFNAIGCGSVDSCCAVAEGGRSGPYAGIRILCTWDSGATWTPAYQNNNNESSIISIRYVSPQEIWAGGAQLDEDNFFAYMIHSTDGGHTWDDSLQVPDMYPNFFSFPVANHGWATALTADRISALMEYK